MKNGFKGKQNWWWSGILLVLLMSFLGYKLYDERVAGKTAGQAFFKSFEGFCINQYCLSKEGGVWIVNDSKSNRPANSEAVEMIKKRIEELVLGEIVSENREKFAGLGIGGTGKVIVSAGEKRLELGKINSSYTGTYVRQEDGEAVYLSQVVLDKEGMMSPEYWERKTISNLPVYQIKKLTIKSGEKSREVTQKDGKWEAEDWVNKVAFLNSEKYLADFEPDESVKFEIEVETENSKQRLVLGKKKNVCWVSDDEKFYFEIKKEDFDLLTGVLN